MLKNKSATDDDNHINSNSAQQNESSNGGGSDCRRARPLPASEARRHRDRGEGVAGPGARVPGPRGGRASGAGRRATPASAKGGARS